MPVVAHPPLERVVERARQDPGILAGILFGSRARGDASPASDYDVALVLQPGAASRLAASRKRLEYLALADLDLVVFQQLPPAHPQPRSEGGRGALLEGRRCPV